MKLTKPKLGKPAMKLPEEKVPPFLADFYYDLRDRRLLLPIALVVVAIAAVPFLLGSKSEIVQAPAAGVVDATLEAGGEKTSNLTVVEAKPGLRDYRKRLGNRSPANPFKQRFTGLPPSAQVESTTGGGSGGEGGGDTGEIAVTEVEEETSGTTTSPGGDGSDGGSSQRYELAVDVQIRRTEETADGGEKLGELEVRHDVSVLTQLPGKKTPVVTLLGANFKMERLVFLVSHEVKSISGEYACVTRGEVCELLEVGLGKPLDFVYEPSGAHYEIKATGADVVPARKRQAARSARIAFAQMHPVVAWKVHSFSK